MKGAKVGGRWTQSWWLSLAIGDIGGTDCRAAEKAKVVDAGSSSAVKTGVC